MMKVFSHFSFMHSFYEVMRKAHQASLVATPASQWGNSSPTFDSLSVCFPFVVCVSTWLPLEVRLDQQIGHFDLPPVQPTLRPLLRLSCTLRSLLSLDVWQSNNVKLMPALTPSKSCVQWFSVGVGFDLPPRCFPLRNRATRRLRCSPQFSPGFSPLFWQLIPGWGPEAFGALMEQSGFRSHCEGLATLSEQEETYDSGRHI